MVTLTASFRRMLDRTATVFAAVYNDGTGKRSKPSATGTTFPVSAVQPADAESRQRYDIDASKRVWTTYCDSANDLVRGGMSLTIDGQNYQIEYIGKWEGNLDFLELGLINP